MMKTKRKYNKEQARQYYQDNVEERKAYQKIYDKQHYIINRAKKAKYHKQWRVDNRVKLIERDKQYRMNIDKMRQKNHYLIHSYGITLEQYNEMFELQEGKCAICGKHQSELKKALAVDHDHETDEIRGLLCSRCNTALGSFYDDIELLEKAIKYLINYIQCV